MLRKEQKLIRKSRYLQENLGTLKTLIIWIKNLDLILIPFSYLPVYFILIDIKIAAYIPTNLIPFSVKKPRCSADYIYACVQDRQDFCLDWKQIPSESNMAF